MLVWPGDELARSRAFWQAATSHRGKHFDLDPDRARDLLELADVLDSYPQYARATAYMRGLTGQGRRPLRDAFPLEFICAGGQAPRNDIPARLPDRPERPAAYRMQVRFHRP